jgi:hypothetical protein
MPQTKTKGREILDGTIEYVDIQDVTANKLLGRVGTNGTVQEVGLDASLQFDGTNLKATVNKAQVIALAIALG